MWIIMYSRVVTPDLPVAVTTLSFTNIIGLAIPTRLLEAVEIYPKVVVYDSLG